MEEKLTEYIKEKYKPLAIGLHGSRANGNAREHSDWDFFIFVSEKTSTDREILFDTANVEVKAVVYPIVEEQLSSYYFPYLRKGNIKILFDPQNLIPDVSEKATIVANTPKAEDLKEKSGHQAWFRSHLDGMIDYQNEHEAFFRKLGELYTRVLNYWFRFLHNTYMPQVYAALSRIEKEDPEYYALIKKLAGNYSNQEKIKAAEEIYRRLWSQ